MSLFWGAEPVMNEWAWVKDQRWLYPTVGPSKTFSGAWKMVKVGLRGRCSSSERCGSLHMHSKQGDGRLVRFPWYTTTEAYPEF